MSKLKAKNHVSKNGALTQVAEYIVDCESNECESYQTYCDENDLNPKDIRGLGQSKHVYALALIGLGMEYPKDSETCEHADVDGVTCLDCGAFLAERLATRAYDKAKDARKYGQ